MATSDDAPDSAPLRVVEVTLPTYQWDQWRERAEAVSGRARRTAVVAGVLTAVLLAAWGLVVLSSAALFSIVLYAPVGGAAVWALVRRLLDHRGLAAVVAEAHQVVVPALVDQIGTRALVALLHQGGTLVTELSTTIISQRRESLVALVASEYDMSAFPAASFPSGGFGP